MDESATSGYYFMGALVMSPENANILSFGMDKLMTEIAAEHQGLIPSSEEFHGKPIWSGDGVWRKIPEGQRYRYEIFKKIFELVANSNAKFAFQGLDVTKQVGRYTYPHPPHQLVLQFLIEKTDRHFEERGTHGLAICDGMNSNEISKHRSQFRNYQKIGTGGPYPRKILRVVDTLHFVSSKDSRLIQAIDMILYLHQRRKIHNFSKIPAEKVIIDKLWDLLVPHIYYERIWP